MGRDDWTIVKTVEDPFEAAELARFLEEDGLQVVRHDVEVTGVFAHESALAGVQLLVPTDDLTRARELLARAPEFEVPILSGTVSDALRHQQCPVHAQSPDVACSRCGVFVCGACVTGEVSPYCDSCDEKLLAEQALARTGAIPRFVVIFLGLAAFVAALLWLGTARDN